MAVRWAVLGLAALAALTVAAHPGPPVQPLVVALFMLVAPGAAVLLEVRSWPRLLWWTAAVATSLAIDVLLSTALLYLGWWSAAAVLSCLVAVCVGGCAAGPVRARATA